MAESIGFKVMSYDRSLRKGVIAKTLEELLQKCREKFNILDETMKMVMETDGTEIDEDFFSIVPGMSQLMVLVGTQIWTPAFGVPRPGSATDGTSTVSNDLAIQFVQPLPRPSSGMSSPLAMSSPSTAERPLSELLTKIRKKQSSLYAHSTRKRARPCKLKIGWLVKDSGRYTQVREKTGGGVREVEVEPEAGYEELLSLAMGFFFPNGRSSRGKANEFNHTLGDFKQSVLTTTFSVMQYIKEHCLFTRPRVYLMSQKKEENGEWFNLPDISFDDNDVDVDFLTDPSETPEPETILVTEDEINDRSEESQQGDEQQAPKNDNCVSPVSITWPRIPTCQICKDRYSDTFLECGHILCYVCCCELEERGASCHVCRADFNEPKKLYY